MRRLKNQRGAALIIALIISMALLATAMGVLYFIERSTAMSGAVRRYETAAEAADGAVNLMRDTINLTMWGDPVPAVFTLPDGDPDCLVNAIFGNGLTCEVSLTLPDSVGGSYEATVKVERLYSVVLPGGRIEFAAAGAGVNPTAVFFRINATAVGTQASSTETAESSVLYRFAG